MTTSMAKGSLSAAQATNAALIGRAAAWHADGHRLALAFVMQSWGSSPRPPGSVMLVREDMAVEGSVSGGCVEGAVIDAAMTALQDGAGQRLDFGVADETAWEVGLSCGGKIAVLVTPVADNGLSPPQLHDMAADIAARRPVHVAFDAATGAVMAPAGSGQEQVARLSGLDAEGGRFDFVENPPRRVMIVGGVHITQFLAPMAQSAGYDVVVIDPRAVFATSERFPGITCMTGWPDEVMADITPDSRTAVVTLTHDPKIDDPGLIAALQSKAFYIGCLGSRRTHAARSDRLRDAGFDADALGRLHGPAGLDIRAKTPAEIAVSILAEMIAVERTQESAGS